MASIDAVSFFGTLSSFPTLEIPAVSLTSVSDKLVESTELLGVSIGAAVDNVFDADDETSVDDDSVPLFSAASICGDDSNTTRIAA